MQIKYLGEEKFEIKTKDVIIHLGHEISVNNFALPGPGEYEKGGIFVEGIADNDNIIYVIIAEEMKMCYLGKISHDIREDEAKEIGDVDILFVPLGKEGSLEAKKALGLVSKIDPRVVIPMLYDDLNLSEFRQAEGIIDDAEMDALKIKRADLPENERKSVILSISK